MPQHLSSLACVALLCALAGCAAAPAPHGYRGTPVTVYAAGDIADCRYRPPGSSSAAATAWLVEAGLAAHPGAQVLTLGDHTYPVGAPAEFSDCYQPTWGRFRERTLPTPGNHEYYSPGAPGYFTYFGARAAPEQGAYYSVQLGKWHPRYSSGGNGNNDFMVPLWQALAESGVELALAGHDHHYERYAPQDAHGMRDDARGIRQFVVGTGGAWLTPVRFPAANTEARNTSVHGVLRLDLFDNGYTWEFLAVADDSAAGPAYTDRGAAPCH
jgi:hypothetical protein